MEQNEFLQRLALIEDLINEANKLKIDMENIGNKVPSQLGSLLPNLAERDNLFIQYLNLLQDFQFSDKLTTPSDLFPGIRTASDMADPTQLNQKANEMKSFAGKINSLQKKSSILHDTILTSLKRCIAELCEYIQQENQIYDLALELLNDADSIYDVGQFAKNT